MQKITNLKQKKQLLKQSKEESILEIQTIKAEKD